MPVPTLPWSQDTATLTGPLSTPPPKKKNPPSWQFESGARDLSHASQPGWSVLFCQHNQTPKSCSALTLMWVLRGPVPFGGANAVRQKHHYLKREGEETISIPHYKLHAALEALHFASNTYSNTAHLQAQATVPRTRSPMRRCHKTPRPARQGSL